MNQPCSGFLLTWHAFTLVLDLGYGTLPQLLSHMPNGKPGAIVITHEHPDHWLDLHGLFRMHYYGPDEGTEAQAKQPARDECAATNRAAPTGKIPLYCPLGVVQKMEHLEPDVDLRRVFDIYELTHGSTPPVGPFDLSGILLPHHVPNIGVRLSLRPGKQSHPARQVLAYTGDTGPTPLLRDLGRDVDLFIVESTDRVGEELKQPDDGRLLTSKEAGYWATEAGARRLLLTHFWPGNDRQASVRNAQVGFEGSVVAAEPGMVIDLGT